MMPSENLNTLQTICLPLSNSDGLVDWLSNQTATACSVGL